MTELRYPADATELASMLQDPDFRARAVRAGYVASAVVIVSDLVRRMRQQEAAPISDGTLPCPVPHPAGLEAPCTKTIPEGWTADEGHGGGHCWMSAETTAILDGGHYDATALIAGQPASTHDPADCDHNCPRYWEEARR